MPVAMNTVDYPGKILLFGEYSVMENSDALVVPYRAVSAALVFSEDFEAYGVMPESNRVLLALAEHILRSQDESESNPGIDAASFRRDAEKGMVLKSTIPLRYGLGSSGALCAAVYDRYAYRKPPRNSQDVTQELYRKTRSILASMESFFHGRSSGIDPLCSYFNRGLHIRGDGTILGRTHEVPPHACATFLIDTGMPRETGKLVLLFGTMLKDPDAAGIFRNQYVPLVNEVIHAFNEDGPVYEWIQQLSLFQYRFFEPMIPVEFRAAWLYGIESGYYALKLCGSGGGGMILGFTPDLTAAERQIKDQTGLSILPLS
jgi:mevalonate kinase